MKVLFVFGSCLALISCNTISGNCRTELRTEFIPNEDGSVTPRVVNVTVCEGTKIPENNLPKAVDTVEPMT